MSVSARVRAIKITHIVEKTRLRATQMYPNVRPRASETVFEASQSWRDALGEQLCEYLYASVPELMDIESKNGLHTSVEDVPELMNINISRIDAIQDH